MNVGLGGDGGNLVDANVAPDSGLVEANVSTGGGNGLVDVDADVGSGLVSADIGVGQDDGLVDAHVGIGGGFATADVNVGGDDGLVGVDVGIGGGSSGSGSGGGGSGGGGSNGGGSGGGGFNGGGSGGGSSGGGYTGGGRGVANGSGSAGGRGMAAALGCVGTDPYRALSLFERTAVTKSSVSAWHKAGSVRVFPVKLCSREHNQLAATLSSSPKLGIIQTSVMTAPAITSALVDAGYKPHNVFAIGRAHGRITVYVY